MCYDVSRLIDFLCFHTRLNCTCVLQSSISPTLPLCAAYVHIFIFKL
uniref:Uncharacterized protein n=1 Tax=Anguilla anguilla TaxID=7936 RepID=A0A0E9W5H0_ANGAN